MPPAHNLVSIALCLAIAACGGGGGNESTSSGAGGSATHAHGGAGGTSSATSGGGGGATGTTSTGAGGAATVDPHEADRLAVIARINEHRATKSLPPFERWIVGEPCADLQAADDAVTGIPHNAWKTGKFGCPGGKNENECPGWGGPGCVDSMWSEGGLPACANCDFCGGDHGCDGCDFYGTITGTTCGHYENLSAKGYTEIAVGFGGGWMLINFN